jgi:hypothetical protein
MGGGPDHDDGGGGRGGIYTGTGGSGKLGNRSLVRSSSGGVDTLVGSEHHDYDDGHEEDEVELVELGLGVGFGFGGAEAMEVGRGVKGCGGGGGGGGNGSTDSILNSRCRVVSSRGSAGSSSAVVEGGCGEDERGYGGGGEDGEGGRGDRNSRAVTPGGITKKVEVLVTRS